jgi:uncharacterized membrane protein YccF (DUF307 family)
MITRSILYRVAFVLAGMLTGAFSGAMTALLCYIIGIKLSHLQYGVVVVSFSLFGFGAGVMSAFTFKSPQQIVKNAAEEVGRS